MTNKSTRRIVKASSNLRDEVKYGVDSVTGYWQARGFLNREDGGDLAVPFEDFLENNGAPGKKKNLMGASNTSDPISPEDMADIFKSVLQTQSKAIPNGFFMYSALLYNQYLTQCQLGRELGCSMNVSDIEAHFPEDDEEAMAVYKRMEVAHIATEFAARCFYEGSGSLGGYKDKVWLLWGRLSGVGCPDNQRLLSDEDAYNASEDYKDAAPGAQLFMFSQWFMEAYSGEYQKSIDEYAVGTDLLLAAVKLFWEAYEMIRFYKAYEGGLVDIDLSNPKEALVGVKALGAGIFRRVSKGITESSYKDYTEANHLSVATTDAIIQATLITLLSDAHGLCPFGEWLINAASVSVDRVAIYEEAQEEYQAVSMANPNAVCYKPSKFRMVQ